MEKYQGGESTFPTKYREFIVPAIAANIECPYWALWHTAMATLNGAAEKEMAEAAFLASYAARWSAMLHALQYNRDTFTKEVHQIGERLMKAAKKQ